MRHVHSDNLGGAYPMLNLSTRRSYYASTISKFGEANVNTILGTLTAASIYAVEPAQRDAWQEEILILRTALQGYTGAVLLEFEVPRIGTRIDAVLLIGSTVFVIEFKVGERLIRQKDFTQAWDYALDLKNFHRGSHHATILPVLVATKSDTANIAIVPEAGDGVHPPTTCNGGALGAVIAAALDGAAGDAIDSVAWANAPYHPTPTIIEAAQALYSQHSVAAIASSEAGENLKVTARQVELIIDDVRASGRKAIIFVTGVPGAGKTLVGLNVATKRRDRAHPTHAVFLSGNGPLVKVLTEALARDEMAKITSVQTKIRKGDVRQKVKAFIQNVHHFRDEGLNHPGAPSDHVVIFDEAQRAWNQAMTSDFMRRKKGRPGFNQSEPEFLLSYLDRHVDWAVVICLVGGGQEIHRGEAGISAWLDALASSFHHWTTYISPNLVDGEYDAGTSLKQVEEKVPVVRNEGLHLSVSMRSFRAEKVSRFVKALLDREATEARSILAATLPNYPIVLTRDLETAKSWVRAKARGSERYGLIASSGAQRLKPHAVDIRVEVDPVHWFLNDKDDTRSSFYLEDAATEFQVQGLELDWACVTWDADFRFTKTDWSCHSFVASKWHNMKSPERRIYLRNAYRVLLTRARQGMVIFVPPGNVADATRAPKFYNDTFNYLSGLGIPIL